MPTSSGPRTTSPSPTSVRLSNPSGGTATPIISRWTPSSPRCRPLVAAARLLRPPGGPETFDPSGGFLRVEALFHQLQADCDNLVQVNQRAMVAKSEAAAGVALRWFLTTLAIVAALVVTGIGLAVFLANWVVSPLRELTATMAKVAGGDLEARARVNSHDEVGILTAGFNSMADRIRQLRRSDPGKLLVVQQTTGAAIDSLYDCGGSRILSGPTCSGISSG